MDNKKNWVVVVDDDVIALKNTRDLLNCEDLRVSSLRSGADLLTFVRKNQPDLILMDIMMPEMDGFETYQKLMEFEDEQGRAHTPVIFLTGEIDADTEQKGLMIGASDFIRKPINKNVLLKRVQNTISHKETIENLTEEALTDKLTGFYNKTFEKNEMPKICLEKTGMLMMIDLDSFKLINDIYGHDMGDKVLTAFANVARRNCREGDILCRVGGDEFLAFFEDTTDENIAVSFNTRLNEQLVDECIALMGEDFDVPIGVSIGCVPVLANRDYETLFQLADKALYQVKQSSKHGCRFYDTGQREEDVSFDPDKEFRRMLTLCNERGRAEQAMMLSQDAFVSVYRYMDRFARRHNAGLTKVLVWLNSDENADKQEFAEAMTALGDVLQSSLRKSDAINKCRNNCYFLLLSEFDAPDEDVVIERFVEKWKQSEYAERFHMEYTGSKDAE